MKGPSKLEELDFSGDNFDHDIHSDSEDGYEGSDSDQDDQQDSGHHSSEDEEEKSESQPQQTKQQKSLSSVMNRLLSKNTKILAESKPPQIKRKKKDAPVMEIVDQSGKRQKVFDSIKISDDEKAADDADDTPVSIISLVL